MKSKGFLKFLYQRRKEIYANPDSILKEYDDFLALNGIYFSHNPELYREKLKGRVDLCGGILEIYNKAKLENEKFSRMQDLYIAGYDKNEIVELILEIFISEPENVFLWEYGNLLYQIRNYRYLLQYVEIANNINYGTSRQMIVLLIGKSKKVEVIPVLKKLLEDLDVDGQALEALTNFSGEDIEEIMQQYLNHEVTWIRNTAKKYLKKKGKVL